MTVMITQLLMAFLGTVGFALRFHLRKSLVIPASLGGLMGWAVYLLFYNVIGQGILISCLVASIAVAFYAEILARLLKAPAVLFLIPGAVPLIPGSSLYYSMSYAVAGQWDVAKEYSIKMIEFALGIAIGISLVLAFFVMKERMKKKMDTDLAEGGGIADSPLSLNRKFSEDMNENKLGGRDGENI